MALHAFLGTWEVVEYAYLLGFNSGIIEGVRFHLDEHGDVTWTVGEHLKSIPLFNTETYEIFCTSSLDVWVRFGACHGHIIEFKAEQYEPRDVFVMTCEGWCKLYCKRVKVETEEKDLSIPFSLLSALEDGYFSDIKIVAANNKEFKIHACIVQLHGKDIEWQSTPPPFTGLKEEVLGTILHFLYAECLPQTLDEETAREVIYVATPYQCLSKLVNMCNVYLKNMELKSQIMALVKDMHNCLNVVIEYFSSSSRYSSPDSIANNPARLCFLVKQSMRELAVAVAKLLLLCDLFSKRKHELTRQERHEIILYARSRLNIFLQEIATLLFALKKTFTSMSLIQRQEVATYLVPEIEVILDIFCALMVEIEKALQKIISSLSPLEVIKSKSNIGDMFAKSLKNVLHMRELRKLQNFHEHITCSLGILLRRKESFNKMSTSQKIRCIATDVEKIIEELPQFLIRFEEFLIAIDHKLDWREFKFCFKVGTSKLSGLLHKIVAHQETLESVLLQICDLVQRNTFTESLQKLQLIKGANMSTYAEDSKKSSSIPYRQGDYKLNLVEELCRPPVPSKNKLSQFSLQLLKSGLGTDMVFEVVVNNSPTEQTMREHVESEQPAEEERSIIRAHRAIVATRCDWFRRALLSGMREAIDKKIVIHDTNPVLFRIFLEYLYSGQLKKKSLTTEQLAELLLLSDRYEVDYLKKTCEFAIESIIDQDCVLYFLSMADQFNARHLRRACLNYVAQHQELTECEDFDELPSSLQGEVFGLIWLKGPPKKSSTTEHLLPDSPVTQESNISSLPQAMGDMNLFSTPSSHSHGSGLEEMPCHDSTRLNNCLTSLRDIVGESPSREKLIEIILAADYDLCRALNYFYAENNQDDEH